MPCLHALREAPVLNMHAVLQEPDYTKPTSAPAGKGKVVQYEDVTVNLKGRQGQVCLFYCC